MKTGLVQLLGPKSQTSTSQEMEGREWERKNRRYKSCEAYSSELFNIQKCPKKQNKHRTTGENKLGKFQSNRKQSCQPELLPQQEESSLENQKVIQGG